jgi:hypothetical protein
MDMDESQHIVNPERIFYSYGELFPDEFEFMVLYHLYTNYPAQEILFSELKQAIEDTARMSFLANDKNRRKERIQKNLFRNFIERVPQKINYFVLTPHAERVIEIVTQRINNPYLKFPLKDTFEMYFNLPENAKEDIQALKSWFRFGFQNNARQVVISHLEGLKLAVDEAIKSLNEILEADGLSAIQMLEKFAVHFGMLGDKARQISEAIQMKVYVHYELRKSITSYTEKVEQELHAVNSGLYEKIRGDREAATAIQEEVHAFFEKIDQQLDLINNKMAFAGTKIAELQESLRVQSNYKISLKKMLTYLLENSTPDAQYWVKLPDSFPKKHWVREKFRFHTLRYYDLGFLKRAQPVEQTMDATYEAEQRVKFEQELDRQALIRDYCEKAQVDLYTAKRLDLSERIFEIMKHEDDLEIAVQMGYEFVRGLGPETDLQIEKSLQSNEAETFHIWKVMIQNKADLAS